MIAAVLPWKWVVALLCAHPETDRLAWSEAFPHGAQTNRDAMCVALAERWVAWIARPPTDRAHTEGLLVAEADAAGLILTGGNIGEGRYRDDGAATLGVVDGEDTVRGDSLRDSCGNLVSGLVDLEGEFAGDVLNSNLNFHSHNRTKEEGEHPYRFVTSRKVKQIGPRPDVS